MNKRTRDALAKKGGLTPVVELLKEYQPSLPLTKHQLRKAECIELVRSNRDAGTQSLGYAPRPFVMCNFPHKRPSNSARPYERYNGDFVLKIVPDPDHGVPFGRDRIWPIYLSTVAVLQQSPVIRFTRAADILDLFGMPKGGAQFERLVEGFKRIFSATIIFGPRETVLQQSLAFVDANNSTAPTLAFAKQRFHFVDQAKLWYDRENQANRFFRENEIKLNATFFEEIMAHPIPADLAAVRALASSPGALDLYMWLSYRCYNIKGSDTPQVPLFGPLGLVHQLGSEQYARPRDFRRQLELWLRQVQALWPGCPAKISSSGTYLILKHAIANHPRAVNTLAL